MNTPDYIQELHIPDTINDLHTHISCFSYVFYIFTNVFCVTGIPRTYLYYAFNFDIQCVFANL